MPTKKDRQQMQRTIRRIRRAKPPTAEQQALHRELTDPVETAPVDWRARALLLEQQRDDALQELNDRANIEAAVRRFHQQALQLAEMLQAITTTSRALKAGAPLMSPLKIGATVWLFDTNHRVYTAGQSGPIYRKHFIPYVIVGETRRSWIVGEGYEQRKIDKQTLTTKSGYGVAPRVFTSEAEIDDDCWVNDNRHAVRRAVGACRDANMLRTIARMVGVSVEEPKE